MSGLRLTIYLLITLVIFTCCTDVVQVKLDEGSELIVIDAFLEDIYDQQLIHIHKNSSYFNTQNPEPILNAQATLYDLTQNKSYKFYHFKDDSYQVQAGPHGTTYLPNHQFKLEVIIDGFTYTALTTQPRAARIDSISTAAFTKDPFTGQERPLFYMCYLWAKDKADNIPDYYWIKSSTDSAFINLCVDGTIGAVKDAAQDSIYFSPPYTLFGLSRFLPGSRCTVSIDAISLETYNFLVQAQAQISNGGMFATTPENVKTNFITPSGAKKKAVGWFSVAAVTEAERTIP